MPIGGEEYGEVVERLRRLLEGRREVVAAYLFGSCARRHPQPRDVDVAVVVRSRSRLSVLTELAAEIARVLGVSEDLVDVVDLERADPLLASRILSQGVKLVERPGWEGVERSIVERAARASEEARHVLEAWLSEDPGVDRELLARRLDEVLRSTSLIRSRYLGRSVDWLLEDLERAYAFKRAMHRAIEAMLDACRHVVSALRLGIPLYYSEYPRRLAEAGLMSWELARKLAEYARLRSILVHRYVELDYEELLEKARELVEEVAPAFTEWARKVMKGVPHNYAHTASRGLPGG